MSHGRRWVGYVRVSHMGVRKQGSDRFHAEEEQRALIERQAQTLGVRVQILSPDLNAKGSDPERETLLQAIEGVEQGRYEGIVVAYLSRLTRRVQHTIEMWDRVVAAGGRLVSVREGLDTAYATPTTKAYRNMLATFAEMELDQHAERFEILRAVATERGIWQRRQTPLGYDRDDATRRLVPNERAKDVAWAFRARATNTSVAEIARRLGMTHTGARKLLENRVYLGELRIGGRTTKDGNVSPLHVNTEAHPAIVSEEDWIAAQYATSARPPRVRHEPSLLAGLVRCAGCGHAMTSAARSHGLAYSCKGRSSAGRCPSQAAITMRLLDQYVEQIALRELARLKATAHHVDREIEEARGALATAERELSAYIAAVSVTDVGEDVFREGAMIRRVAVADARERLAGALAKQPTAVDGDPIEHWKNLDNKQRNRLLRGLIEATIVASAGRGRIVPIESRVRVIKHGAGVIESYAGGGVAHGIRPVEINDLDGPVVLRV